jgi:hypothetical protein
MLIFGLNLKKKEMTLGNFYYSNSQKDEIEDIITNFNIDLDKPSLSFFRSYSRDWFSLSITGEVEQMIGLVSLLPPSIY